MTTTEPTIGEQDRDQVVLSVDEAYEMLDLLPGVDPNGPVLVWLVEQFLPLRRGIVNGDRG